MIVSFRHKGLRRLYQDDNPAGVRTDQAARLRRILSLLDQIATPEEMGLPGLRLHPLKGELKGFWSVSVSGNWRVIFRVDGKNVAEVALLDYH